MEMRIWKDKTPKGDGNFHSPTGLEYPSFIWKDKTPKGDGNPSNSLFKSSTSQPFGKIRPRKGTETRCQKK